MSLSSFRGVWLTFDLPASLEYDETAEFMCGSEADFNVRIVEEVVQKIMTITPPRLVDTATQYLTVATLKKSNGHRLEAVRGVDKDSVLTGITILCPDEFEQDRGSSFWIIRRADLLCFKVERPACPEYPYLVDLVSEREIIATEHPEQLAEYRNLFLTQLRIICDQ